MLLEEGQTVVGYVDTQLVERALIRTGTHPHQSLLHCTMGSLGTGHWPQVLVHMLLLQLQSVKVQGGDPVSQKLRRLNEQNRTSSQGLESRVQALNDHYHYVSHDLEHLKHSTTQEINSLRQWSRKLNKKTKRIEGRLALMERTLRENCRQTRKLQPDPGQYFSNFTLELHSQEERLAALQGQRDELLTGIKGLQGSLKNQALRVSRLEGRLSEVQDWNGKGKVGGSERAVRPVSSNITPQEYSEPLSRSQTQRGGRPGGLEQPRREATGHTDSRSQATLYHHHTTNRPKHSKAWKPRPPSESHRQVQIHYPNPKPKLDPFQSQSRIQTWTQTRPYAVKQDHLRSPQTVPYYYTQIQQPSQPHSHPQKQPRIQDHKHPSWTQLLPQVPPHPEPNKNIRNRSGLGVSQPQTVLTKPQHESYQPGVSQWDEGQDDKSDTKLESSVIHNLLQIPVRHKIPAQPLPKKDATICNVDSVLLFPSASAENYVTFSLRLPDLHELSLCLWLRVEATHVGTLLSYATDDNDNQLVLYGRSSSASSTPFSASSSPSHPPYFSPSSPSSSPSVDFVIGDPAYRRLPVSLLLDTHWHHLCVLWSSIQGRFWHYNDRRLSLSGSNFRKGWEIPGGGSVVLGQEQDSVGGGFDPAQGFAGQIAGFRVWNRVLSPSEVEGVAEGRGVPRGVVLGMEDIKEVHGEVQQVACECLEHCV
ncbi:uncharacterized protein ptx4 [Brachyistius frenatus]|uniref:uncharacterized protein ptx4 n=1 Tax=Brachyistius frenatus TaxID=100188 RepID=UPI0037E8BC82